MTTKELILSHNKNALYGTLTVPASGYAHKTILFLHSSERSHRDDDYFPELAEYAAKQGIASFRYDSPGSGSSTGNAFLQSIEERCSEAQAWLTLLQEQEELDASGIGISGLSEGAVIAFKADIKEAAFLAPVSFDAFPFPASRFINDITAELKDEGHDDLRIKQEILQLSYGFKWLTIPEGDFPLDINSLSPDHEGCTPLLALPENASEEDEGTVLRQIIESNRKTHGDWKYFDYILNDMDEQPTAAEMRRNKVLWKEFASLEPAKYADKNRKAVFAAYGEADTYFPIQDSINLYKSKDNWSVKTYPGMGHSIDSDDGFSKEFMKDLCEWINNLS